jgi:hypothetical protein
VKEMVKMKELICAAIPDELALKVLDRTLRYKHIPERLGFQAQGTMLQTNFQHQHPRSL